MTRLTFPKLSMNLTGVVVVSLLGALCGEVAGQRTPHYRPVRRTLRPPYNGRATALTPLWFEQKLDHFNTSTKTTFKQKYYINSEYHKAGGPVFLYISGEGPAEEGWMYGGAWIENAQVFNALCFQLEHRFYGNSRPTKDLSLESLQYLSSEQALGDLAYFTQGMNKKYNLPAGTKWVAFGGSYAGALAAWFRTAYPSVVHAAVSSSGPVLATADNNECLGSVARSLAKYTPSGKSCVEAIHSATKEMTSMLKSSNGLKELTSAFRVCEDLATADKWDISNFFLTLANTISGTAQGNNNDWSSWNTSTTRIDKICSIMNNASYGSPLKRYAKVSETLVLPNSDSCLGVSNSGWIQSQQHTSWGVAEDGGRQWFYQCCSELGYFDTSSLEPHIFGNNFPLEFFVQQCSGIFGPSVNETSLKAGAARNNKLYGGLNPNVSNVVFVQGSVDPGNVIGITKSPSPSAPAIYMDGTSHCSDMYNDNPGYDLPQITAAHKEIRSYLKKWLQ